MVQQKEKMNYKLLLMLIIPAIGIFFLFLYVSNREEVKEEKNRVANVVPIPNEEKEKLPETKVGLYQQMKQKREEALREGGKNDELNEKDFISMLDENEEEEKEKKEEIKVEEPKENVNRTVKKKSEPVVQEKKEEEVKIVYVEKPVEEKKRGGMGIIKSGVVQESGESGSKMDNDLTGDEIRYFPAILEESTQIKTNSSVVFLLMEDMLVGEIKIYKNSYLFGKARNSGGVFDIKIEEIKNTDGRLVSLRDKTFYVYDEKYSKGLPHEGDVNEAIREAGRETSRDVSGDIVGSTTGGTAANITLRAIDKTIQSVSKKREVSINLSKGYKVYIKQENI